MKKVVVFFAIIMLVPVVSLATWVSEGLTGKNISVVSSGRTRTAVEPGTDTVWLKVSDAWKGFPISGVNTVFSDNTSGVNFIGSSTEVYKEENGSLYNIAQCTDERCVDAYFGSAISGTVADGQVFAIASNGTPYVCADGITTGIWNWDHRTTWNVSGISAIGNFENRLFATNSTSLFREANVGSEDMEEISTLGGATAPKNISGHSSGVYTSNASETVDRVYWDGSTWQDVSIPSSKDVKTDNNLTFVLGSDGLVYKTADGTTLTALEALSDASINSISVYGGSVYVATDNGVYRLDLAPAATSLVTTSVVGSNINISWNPVAGIVGYKIYYGSSYSSFSEINVGASTSYSIPAAGVNVLWVVAYNVDGYESVGQYKTICNPLDTLPPTTITDLALKPLGPNSILAEWSEPGDNYLTAGFDLRRSSVAITSRNWATSTQVVGEPMPSGQGTSKSLVVSGLTPDTTYYFTIRANDSCNRISPIYNSKSVRTLSTGTKMVGFGRGNSDRADGYEVCCGVSPSSYTSCQDVGLTNPGYVLMQDSGSTRYCIMQSYNQYGYTVSNEMLIIP